MHRSRSLRLPAICLILCTALIACFFLTRPAVLNTEPEAIAPAAIPAVVTPIAAPRERAEEAVAPVAATAPASAPIIHQNARWEAPVAEPVFAEFREWTSRFANLKTEVSKANLLSEGIALSERRRAEMADLIDQNPKRALELAVPASVRRHLPAEIVGRLEQLVAGRGDLWVAAAIAMPGAELKVRAVQRTLVMSDGRQFDTYTFGQRENVPTKRDIPVQGIAVDGKLALNNLPGRVMEPEEVRELQAAASAPAVCPTSGLASNQLGEETVVDWDGAQRTFFCGANHAMDAMIAAAGVEIAAGGEAPIAESGYTEGIKKMLIIRVDFPDAPGQVVSDATLTTLVSNMASHWSEMSFGKTTWSLAGSGSAITPTLRLPSGHANYTDFVTMLNAARSAATDAGFNYLNYSFEVIVTGDNPGVGFGGIAYVGARGAWLANSQWNLGVCSHEVGHNFGLNHAGFWDTTDGTSIGAGSAVEYGNPFDHMGGASSATTAHFGARQKNYLQWIVAADVAKVSVNGTTTTRIHAFDKTASTGIKALAVDRTGTANDYWIEYRQAYAASNKWMNDGVVLNWGDVNVSNMKPLLLDFTPDTGDLNDSPVLIGRTFSDTTAGVYITPIGRGTDTNGVAWMDVTVNRGPFTGNSKPNVSVGASSLTALPNAVVTFTATATDPENDVLGYFWEWGDGTFTANNSATASHSWSAAGTQTVRCRVTDMKGQTATGQILIQVGIPVTFFIQGVVSNTAGAFVENALVSADATHSDTTDSEGYYAITGLPAGSYSLAATKAGLTIQPKGFANPVTVGPSKQNINFTAPPGAPAFGTMKPGLVDQGSNSGPIILPLTDADTTASAIAMTAVSSNQAIIPNANITFGTIGTTIRTVTVTAGANVSGQVNIIITATDPEGSSADCFWPVTINAKPSLNAGTTTTAENTAIDIDLRTLVSDDLTALDKLAFEVSRVRNGSVLIQPDGYTARFTPALNYNGPASFNIAVRDRSLSSRTLFLYDFEPPDTTADGKITDQSNYDRNSTFEIAGTGAEYSFRSDVPAALAPYGVQSVTLTEAGTGAARIRKTLAATDLNYNDSDWSFSIWAKRTGRTTDDFILHLGQGDGLNAFSQLGLYFPANSDTLKLAKYGTAGLEHEIAGPNLSAGTWHHLAVIYDRTAASTGTIYLYVDGFLYGQVPGVVMDINQTYPLYLGGTQDSSANLDRWFNGEFDDVLLQSGLSSRAEVWSLAHSGTRHILGLGANASVSVTVTGANQPPSMSDMPDAGLFVGGTTPSLPFLVADAETEARNLIVTASSSNTTLLPVSGIAIGNLPAAWTSSDIGTVGAAGSFLEDHGTLFIAGSGVDIGATNDRFRSVRQDFSGNGEIIARVASMDFTSEEAKAGLMMRDSITSTAPYAFACVTPANGASFYYRAANGGAAALNATVNGVAAPCWLRLVRTGGNFTAYYASDSNGVRGVWMPIGTAQSISFSSPTNNAGFGVTSKVDGTLCTAQFERLGGTIKLGGERTLTLTPAAGQQGSSIVTLSVSDGVATADKLFTLSVNPNTPPTVSPISNVTGTGGTLIPSMAVTIGDVHSLPESLTLSATSSNPLLLPTSRITISGTGALRTLNFTPIASETGTATITLLVSDGTLTTTRTFSFTVNPGDPSAFLRAGSNWRYLDTGSSPAGWQQSAFDDSAWPVGPAQLGFGEGDEATAVKANQARVTTYFRHSFQCADPVSYANLKVRLLRDDGAVVYLNGAEIYRSNMPAGPIANSTQAVLAINGADENVFEDVQVVAPPLVAGTNVIAVEVHQKGTTSTDLSFDLSVQGVGPAPLYIIEAGAQWKYLDTGADPGATWIAAAFADAAWLSGPAQLGYGDGDEATVVASGTANAHPITTYFRRAFQVADPARFAQLAIRLLRDDGAVVYLNGQELFRDNMPAGTVTTSTVAAAGITTADENTWQVYRFDPKLLVAGPNIIAVEIHQADVTSSDISFDLQLLAYAPNSLPAIQLTPSQTGITLTWPGWALGWQLQSASQIGTWTAVPGTPLNNGKGQFEITLPLSGTQKFYRLLTP